VPSLLPFVVVENTTPALHSFPESSPLNLAIVELQGIASKV
jgi:hypothetical protein